MRAFSQAKAQLASGDKYARYYLRKMLRKSDCESVIETGGVYYNKRNQRIHIVIHKRFCLLIRT